MLARNYAEFIEYFKGIDDPRQDEKVLYTLREVLLLVLAGVLGCEEDWESIIEFGESKMHIFQKFFPYEQRLPSI